jgi:hypothetical protein
MIRHESRLSFPLDCAVRILSIAFRDLRLCDCDATLRLTRISDARTSARAVQTLLHSSFRFDQKPLQARPKFFFPLKTPLSFLC